MNGRLKRFYEFDRFRIDIDERRLTRDDEPVTLTPKVFDILLELVENNGRTVSKDELMERVWTDTNVEYGNLSRNISTLRRVLGEDSHAPRLIKTVPTRGYRFDSRVKEIVEEEETLSLEKRTNYSLSMKTEESTKTYRRFGPLTAFLGGTAALLILIALIWAGVAARQNGTVASAAEITKRGTADDEAFDLYQKGRALWQNRSVDGLHNATILLEQAVARDPNFARAHAALADAYAFDVINWKRAEATANEAIKLDPGMGEPHATIGFVKIFWEWNEPAAEASFRRAVTLSPNYATGHQWYALSLASRENLGGALAEMDRALELEPTSVSINTDRCQLLYFTRRYDQAVEQCRKTLELDRKSFNVHVLLYEILTAKQEYAAAIEFLSAANDNNPTSARPADQMEGFRNAYRTGGMDAFWRMRLRMFEGLGPMGSYGVARYYARLGDRHKAIDALKQAYSDRNFDFLFFGVDPVFDRVAREPEFIELRKKLWTE